MSEQLALLGGNKTIEKENEELFKWPIITQEHEDAVIRVMREENMSGLNITKEFEEGYAKMLGKKYGLTSPNGTTAIKEAMFALGVGVGDEVIAPSITFWASVLQVYNLGATPVFADIDPDTLCIDPNDIEHRITENTKLIVITHYGGMPADMDAIMEIARRHNIKVLEDCSHAHGALYKGKEVGTIGDVGAFSLMSVKSFAIGEAGIFVTDDRTVYDRALLYGHYLRHDEIESNDLKKYTGMPCGAHKNRLNQITAAFGLVQLKKYPEQKAEIDKAMNYFCDQLEDVPGIKPIRPEKNSGSTKGGWYYPLFKYVPDELEGLSLTRFARAVNTEGSHCSPGATAPMHLHPALTEMDIYGHGKPTRIANYKGDNPDVLLHQSLPVSESINPFAFEVPWFKHFWKEEIDKHVEAYKKVSENYKLLLEDDNKELDKRIGAYSSAFSSMDDY